MGDALGAAFDIGVRAVLVTDHAAPSVTDEAIEIAGIRMLGRSDWAGAVAAFDRPLDLELLVLDAAGVADAVLEESLPILDDRARRQNVQIVVSFAESQINIVTAHLFGRYVHLLCAPALAERVAALALAGRVRLDTAVSEIGQDAQTARLRRLNEEVARIAETLARLTRDDDVIERPIPTFGDRRNAYGAPPSEDGVGAHELRQAIRSRRLRAQFFEPSLLEDPAWDMLLDLYAAELERAQVSVSSLCIAAAVAPTTALRWIAKMTDAGLLKREPDPFDRRRAFMALSGTAREGLRGYFAAVKRAGLSIA